MATLDAPSLLKQLEGLLLTKAFKTAILELAINTDRTGYVLPGRLSGSIVSCIKELDLQITGTIDGTQALSELTFHPFFTHDKSQINLQVYKRLNLAVYVYPGSLDVLGYKLSITPCDPFEHITIHIIQIHRREVNIRFEFRSYEDTNGLHSQHT